MSEKKSFSGLIDKLQSGVRKMNSEAKAKAEGRANIEPEIEAVNTHDSGPNFEDVANEEQAEIGSANLHDETEAEDGFIISEVEEQAPKKSGSRSMSGKQKALVAAGLIGLAFVAKTMMVDAPLPSQITAQSESQQVSEGENDFNNEISFDFGNESTDEGISKSSMEDQAGAVNDEFAGAEGAADDPNALLGESLQIAEFEGELNLLGMGETEMLDPFSKEVITEPQGEVLAIREFNQDTEVEDSFELGAPLEKEIESPFAVADSKSPELSGTEFQNKDSEESELLDQSAKANVVVLQTEIKEKDIRISELERKLEASTRSLQEAESKLKNSGHRPTVANSIAPSASPKPVQRSTPMQSVARASARPNVCVSAIAQAARNCTTCVPHAFITHNGSETMVGQGDYIEGLRISITGDRLDLQNSQGDVAHKYWSSQNGCAGKTNS